LENVKRKRVELQIRGRRRKGKFWRIVSLHGQLRGNNSSRNILGKN
jgi:hypothetical protein